MAKALIKKKEFDLAKEATTTMTRSSNGTSSSSAYSSSTSSLTRNSNEFILESKRDFITNPDDNKNSDQGENLACYPLMLFFLFVTALFVMKRIVLTILFKSHSKSLWK